LSGVENEKGQNRTGARGLRWQESLKTIKESIQHSSAGYGASSALLSRQQRKRAGVGLPNACRGQRIYDVRDRRGTETGDLKKPKEHDGGR